jgi:hypothetical protein
MKKIWTEEKLNELDNEALAELLDEICVYELHYSEEQIDELFEDILDTREDSFDRKGVISWILTLTKEESNGNT